MNTTLDGIEFDAQRVQHMLERGTGRLVDIREADEHRRERISGSTLLPGSTLNPRDLVDPAGMTTILYCRTGRRCRDVMQRLRDAGCGPVAYLRGGLEEWKAYGLPVEVDRKAPRPVMQQTQLTIGVLILISTVLGIVWTPWFLAITLFMGCGLIYAGLSGNCGMAALLARAPWNGSCRDVGVCKR